MKVDPRSITDGWRYAHGYYSNEEGGAMCSAGRLYNDGYMTTVVCSIKGDYANCATCEYNPHYDSFVEKSYMRPIPDEYPKFHYSFKPIPHYCTDCKNKSTCKDIQQGIEWCPNKEE